MVKKRRMCASIKALLSVKEENIPDNGKIIIPEKTYFELLHFLSSLKRDTVCTEDDCGIYHFISYIDTNHKFSEDFYNIYGSILDKTMIQVEYNIEFFRKYKDIIPWNVNGRDMYFDKIDKYGVDYRDDIFFDDSFINEFKEYINWTYWLKYNILPYRYAAYPEYKNELEVILKKYRLIILKWKDLYEPCLDCCQKIIVHTICE